MRRPVLLALLLLAGPVGADDQLTPRQRGNLAIGARHVLNKYCAECHDRNGQSVLPVLEHRKLLPAAGAPAAAVTPGNPAVSQVIEFLEDGTMPPGNRPRPSADEIDTLKDWVQTGATAFPKVIDDRYVLDAIQADVAAAADTNDVPGRRYLTLHHLIRDGSDPPDLTPVWMGIMPALGNHAKIHPVDPLAVVLRFDITHRGWDDPNLFEAAEHNHLVGNLTPYDLILLEYPFGVHAPADHPLNKSFLEKAKQVRPVPFVRADWLVEQLLVVKDRTPALRVDLNALDRLAEAVREPKIPPQARPQVQVPQSGQGPKPPPAAPPSFPFGLRPAVRFPLPQAGNPQPLPPLNAWYAGDVSADRPPFKLDFELVVSKSPGLKPGTVKSSDAFRLTAKADKRVFFEFFHVLDDGEIRLVEPRGGNWLEADKSRNLTSNSGTTGGFQAPAVGSKPVTEHFVLFAAEEQLPAAEFFRSKHNGPYIYRFVHRFDRPKPGAVDWPRVVRKVLPVTIVP